MRNDPATINGSLNSSGRHSVDLGIVPSARAGFANSIGTLLGEISSTPNLPITLQAETTQFRQDLQGCLAATAEQPYLGPTSTGPTSPLPSRTYGSRATANRFIRLEGPSA